MPEDFGWPIAHGGREALQGPSAHYCAKSEVVISLQACACRILKDMRRSGNAENLSKPMLAPELSAHAVIAARNAGSAANEVARIPPNVETAAKEKPHRKQLRDQQELLPMRLAQIRAGIRRRSVWGISFKSILARSTS